MKKHYRKENDCLNCGCELQGKFCHKCGQENLQMKESFGHMMNHAVSDYFHFDDQFFSTIKPLFLKPGFLSNEYMAGRRMRYLHPVKMYIFISLIYFVLLFQPGSEPAKATKIDNKKETKKTLVAKSKALDSVAKDPNMPALAKDLVVDTKKNVDIAIVKNDTADDDDNLVYDNGGYHIPGTTHDTTYAQYLADQQKLSPHKRSGIIVRMINKKAISYRQKYGSRTKEVFFEQFKHNIPKMMFLMLPLCALIFQIAFWSNKKYYVEHLIYTIHLHCFIFLFLAIIMLIEMITPASWIALNDWITIIATGVIVWYLYKSMQIFYHRSRFRTITKMIGSAIMYTIAFSFCITIVFLITALLL